MSPDPSEGSNTRGSELDGAVWLITGASAGFGQAIALEVLGRGGRVVATARNARSGWERMNGVQPGDPALAARAIVNTVRSPSPPLRLLLGSNAADAAARGDIP